MDRSLARTPHALRPPAALLCALALASCGGSSDDPATTASDGPLFNGFYRTGLVYVPDPATGDANTLVGVYDAASNTIEQSATSPDGETVLTVLDELDDAGRPTLRTMRDARGEITDARRYRYGDNGLPETEVTTRGDGSVVTATFAWNADDRVSSVTGELADARGRVTGVERSSYDYENGRLVSGRIEPAADATGGPVRLRFETDAAGHVLTREAYAADSGALLARADYTYDADGNLASAEEFDGAGAQTYTAMPTYERSPRPIYNRDRFAQRLNP